ncbi:MAG: hypothetical protein E7580_06010 [Ruminococcaceae bacterium]|nr:hypothetical protein [Oscillospiraceae bacterium]
MKFIPKNVVGHFPAEKKYKGVIVEQKPTPDERYLWLLIEVEGKSSMLNITIPTGSMLFNTFATAFADSNGEVDTKDFIDTEIEFTLKDREINGTIYSRFATLEAVMES